MSVNRFLRSSLAFTRRASLRLAVLGLVVTGGEAFAQAAVEVTSPRWMIEIKGGRFEPELDAYEQFYGDAESSYYGIGFAYRFRRWLEAGAEIAYMREKGVGLLSEEEIPGGAVTYTLAPVYFFVNLRGMFTANQLFVPYLGIGLTEAYYEEKIDSQPDRTGTSELGSIVRAGLQLSLNRLDPDARGGYDDGEVKESYLFIELQRFTTEQAQIELGGTAAVLGFRFEFGRQ